MQPRAPMPMMAKLSPENRRPARRGQAARTTRAGSGSRRRKFPLVAEVAQGGGAEGGQGKGVQHPSQAQGEAHRGGVWRWGPSPRWWMSPAATRPALTKRDRRCHDQPVPAASRTPWGRPCPGEHAHQLGQGRPGPLPAPSSPPASCPGVVPRQTEADSERAVARRIREAVGEAGQGAVEGGPSTAQTGEDAAGGKTIGQPGKGKGQCRE